MERASLGAERMRLVDRATKMRPRCRRRQSGFTLAEVMVYTVLAAIVLTSVYQLLLGQSRSYGKQREMVDVHGSLRAASALLAWEIRQASAADGDIYAIGANSITLRSMQGSGTVCKRHPTLPKLGIRGAGSEITATADDSALVFFVGGSPAADDSWKILSITAVTPTAPLVDACEWGGTPSVLPDFVVTVAPAAPADTAGLSVGSPFRAFRRVEYGIYLDGGRWWLGRKVGASVTYEKLTGPLRSQVAGGLVFTYADVNGVPTVDPTQVATVDFIIRAESYLRPPGQHYQADSLATRVAIRG